MVVHRWSVCKEALDESAYHISQSLLVFQHPFQAIPMAAKFENECHASISICAFVKLGLRMISGSRRGIAMLVAEARAEVCVVIAAITERIFLSGEASFNGGLGVVEPRGRRRVVVVWESGGWRGVATALLVDVEALELLYLPDPVV
jgi:hypothetical protein